MAKAQIGLHDTQQPEWFASWFDSPHYYRLYAHRDHAEAARFIDALVNRLCPASGAKALDLGCGAGRHARQLASRGMNVTGLDLSEASIRTARAFEHRQLRFACHDMRRPFGSGAFDYVFNLFTSFGYFDDPAEHLAVVGNMAGSLKKGGRLVLDYLNVEYAEAREIRHETVVRDGSTYDISRWNDAGHFFKQIVVNDAQSASRLQHVERVAKFSRHDFELMFALYGMAVEDVYGDYHLSPYRAGDVASTDHDRAEGAMTEAIELSARKALPDAADRFWRDPEVGSQHPLRHALRNRRIGLEELLVSLLRRRAQRCDDALVLGGCVLLQSCAECRGIAGHGIDHLLMGWRVDEEHFGVFDRVDEVRRRRAGHQAGRVRQPPRFWGELDDVFLALRVDHVVAKAACRDEGRVRRHIAGALQEVAGSKSLHQKRGSDEREFLVTKRGASLEIRSQNVKSGHR